MIEDLFMSLVMADVIVELRSRNLLTFNLVWKGLTRVVRSSHDASLNGAFLRTPDVICL